MRLMDSGPTRYCPNSQITKFRGLPNLSVTLHLFQQPRIAAGGGKFGVHARPVKIAFGNVDFAECDVRVRQRRFLFKCDQQVMLGFSAFVLHAIKLRQVVVPFRPLGILFESALLFGDLARGFVVERLIGDAAEKRELVAH